MRYNLFYFILHERCENFSTDNGETCFWYVKVKMIGDEYIIYLCKSIFCLCYHAYKYLHIFDHLDSFEWMI